MPKRKQFMGWEVGQTFQSRVHSYQFGRIEKFEDGEIHVLTPRTPEDPATIKDKVREILRPGDFKRQWKKV